MHICDHCHGTGKFKSSTITVNGKTVEIPEQECKFCDGKGVIAAPQMGEGYPPIIGCREC